MKYHNSIYRIGTPWNRFLAAVLSLCFLSLCSLGLSGAPVRENGQARNPLLDKYGITFITTSDGLPCNSIDDILVDSRGFMWAALIGGGLVRYDGYSFEIYNTTSSPLRIKGNFINNIVEDRFHRLWVVSDGGISVISLDSFEDVTESVLAAVPGELLEKPFPSFLMIDGKGRVWISNSNRIACLTVGDDGSILDYFTMNLEPVRVSPIVMGDVNGRGEVWVSLEGVISRVEPSDSHKIISKGIDENLRIHRDCYVGAYLEKDADVWIATADGLIRYDRHTGAVRRFLNNTSDPSSLTQNFVTSLCVLPDNTLVVGTLRGLNIYNPLTEDFIQMTSDPLRPCSNINCDFINGMRFSAGCLWVGTEGGGINKFSPRRLRSRTIRHDIDDPSSIPDHPVNAIYCDEDERVWVGSVEGGLNLTDMQMKSFRHFTTSNSPLTHNSVSAITSDGKGGLWVGTWGGGLNRLDIDNPSRAINAPYTSWNGTMGTDYIGSLAYDPYNQLVWVGCNRGIYYVSLATGESREAYPGSWKDADGSLGAAVTRNGELWMGGINGLIVFDLKRGLDASGEVPHRFITGDGLPKRITYIAENEADGKMYIATNGSGVFRCEMVDGKEKFHSLSEKVATNMAVTGLAFDSGDNLWVAANNVVECLRPDGSVISFGRKDGLMAGNFYWNASLTLPDGGILLGCSDGMIKIATPHRTPAFSMSAVNGDSAVKVVFTKLYVDHERVTGSSDLISGDISTNPEVKIHQSVKTLGLEFSSLDYLGGFSGHYEYRLSGFEKDWIVLQRDRHYITYTNLSPGSYKLEVRYVADGQNPEDAVVTVLPVRITPYFYNQLWFIFLVIFGLLLIIGIGYRLRLKNLIRQRKRLIEKIDERTREIEQQKDLLQSRADDLTATNEQLRQRNDEVVQQKEQITEMNSYVQRVNLERLNFFTNITHEFRTPITLIMGPISRALKLSTNPQVIEQLNLVERNSRYLLSLVNQLMDFRRIESGKMEIMLSTGNIIDMVEETIKPFRPMASERNISIEFLHHITRPVISHDEDATRKVLINFIANALKFTPEGGRVRIYLSLLPPKGDDPKPRLYLAVADTGSGIPSEDVNHVFDKFYQGHTAMRYPSPGGTTGSGIGLYLCQQIIEMYNGEISVRNNPSGVGCTFRTIFPVSASEETPVVVTAKADGTETPGAESPRRDDSPRQTVLVVEDNADMRSYIRSILISTYDILEAENGKEALAILHSRPVDFIITDLMMPVMDGAELARRVKSDFEISHIPILVLTAKTAQSSRIESYRVGVEEYLLKPFDEKILVTRIRNILDNKRRYQQQFNSGMKTEELNIESDSRDKRFMDQVMEVLKNNYKNSHFDVGDFAEALGVSRTLLNNKLSNLAGQSAVTLIRSYRMTVAKEMIIRNRTSKRYNISEIAYEVGFNDSKYFTRCFTRHFGMPPSAMLSGDDQSGDASSGA